MFEAGKTYFGDEIKDVNICLNGGTDYYDRHNCGKDMIFEYPNIDKVNYGDYIFIGISNGINVYIDKFWFKYGMIKK